MLNGEIAQRVRELTRQICERLERHILRGVISKDYVHLLVSAPPKMAPVEIMRRIKGRTSLKLFEEYPHLKKRYWGRGYFCVTAGELTREMIQVYLEHHFEPRPEDDFEVEE